MGILDRLRWGKKALNSADALGPGMASRSQVYSALSGRPVEYDELVAARDWVPALRTCNHLKATTVAQTKMRVYRKATRDGAQTRAVSKRARKSLMSEHHAVKMREAASDENLEEVVDPRHSAVHLLNNWNDRFDEYSGMYTIASWLDLVGGSGIACVQSGSEPEELWPLATNRLWMVPDEDRAVPSIVGYRYGETSADASERFALDDVILIGTPSLTDPFKFDSPYQSAINEIRQLYQYGVFNLNAIMNDGSPGDVFSGIKTDTEREKLERLYAAQKAGAENAGQAYFLTGDITHNRLGIDKEAQFLEGDKEAQAKIFKVANVPLTMLEQENANLAGAKRAPEQYVEFAIKPLMRQIEDALNAQLAPKFDGEVCFGFDPVNAEEEGDATVAVSMYSGQIATKNEARAVVGLDPVDGGDEFAESPAADPFASLFNPITPRKPETSFEDVEVKQKACEHKSTVKMWTDILYGTADHTGCECSQKPKGMRGQKDDDDRNVDSSDDARRAALEVERETRGFFERVLPQAANIMASNTDPSLVERLVAGMIESEAPTLREAVDEPLRRMALAGYQQGGANIPGELGAFEVLSDEASDAFTRRMQFLTDVMGETTGQQVGTVMRSAMDQGATPTEAAGLLRERIPDMSANRAETIARTEVAHALNSMEDQAWKDSGVVKGAEFVLSTDPCDLCVAVANKWRGKVRKLDEPYVKAGETIAGVTFNRDATTATIHPRCNCSQTPVLDT